MHPCAVQAQGVLGFKQSLALTFDLRMTKHAFLVHQLTSEIDVTAETLVD